MENLLPTPEAIRQYVTTELKEYEGFERDDTADKLMDKHIDDIVADYQSSVNGGLGERLLELFDEERDAIFREWEEKVSE